MNGNVSHFSTALWSSALSKASALLVAPNFSISRSCVYGRSSQQATEEKHERTIERGREIQISSLDVPPNVSKVRGGEGRERRGRGRGEGTHAWRLRCRGRPHGRCFRPKRSSRRPRFPWTRLGSSFGSLIQGKVKSPATKGRETRPVSIFLWEGRGSGQSRFCKRGYFT